MALKQLLAKIQQLRYLYAQLRVLIPGSALLLLILHRNYNSGNYQQVLMLVPEISFEKDLIGISL